MTAHGLRELASRGAEALKLELALMVSPRYRRATAALLATLSLAATAQAALLGEALEAALARDALRAWAALAANNIAQALFLGVAGYYMAGPMLAIVTARCRLVDLGDCRLWSRLASSARLRVALPVLVAMLAVVSSVAKVMAWMGLEPGPAEVAGALLVALTLGYGAVEVAGALLAAGAGAYAALAGARWGAAIWAAAALMIASAAALEAALIAGG